MVKRPSRGARSYCLVTIVPRSSTGSFCTVTIVPRSSARGFCSVTIAPRSSARRFCSVTRASRSSASGFRIAATAFSKQKKMFARLQTENSNSKLSDRDSELSDRDILVIVKLVFDVSVIIVVLCLSEFSSLFCIENEYAIKLTPQIYMVNLKPPTVKVKNIKKVINRGDNK